MMPENYATFLNTKTGDKIRYRKSGPHWFSDRIENAKKLIPGKIYTVKEITVASSSTAVTLEETNEPVELSWFDIVEK
jgi:hypothetical protein